jgi:nucleotidyltransferase substrate binding protein (TIGR01987 family)
MTNDIRWLQRFSNYQQALNSLTAAVDLSKQRALSELEQQGLIQAFEFTHELAWNCLKDYLQYQGEQNLMGSRDATRKAFSIGMISAGDIWMDMIASRNRTSHTYNQETARQIVAAIINDYHEQFCALRQKLSELKENI